MKRLSLMIGAATLTLALAACGSDSPDSKTDAGTSHKLRVTTIGLCNEQIVWGINQKMFGDLQIDLLPVQSGAAALAALTAGETDVAFVNSLTSFTAIDKGQPLKIIADTALSTEGANGVIVKADSGIKSVKDLQGKTVAVNGLKGLGQVMTDYWIAKESGEPSTAKWTQLPFDQLLPAVAGGKVAAAQVAASQVAEGQKDGTAVSLGNPFYVNTGPIPTAFYLATSDWVSKHQAEASAFAEGMQKASESANDASNDSSRFKVLADFCKSSVEDLQGQPESTYEGKVTMTAYDALVKVLAAQKAISGDHDLDAAVPDFARQ